MSQSSPSINHCKQRSAAKQLAARVNKCWMMEFNWDLIPPKLKEVCFCEYTVHGLIYIYNVYLNNNAMFIISALRHVNKSAKL